MLTLDQSTLFYWNLSDSNNKKRKHGRIISEWASAIPSNAKAGSRAPSRTTTARKPASSHSDSILPLPSLTSGTSGSTAPSVLTKNIRIVSHMAPTAQAKVKPEPEDITIHSDAGLSHNDETKGNEREAAPPKGRSALPAPYVFFLFSLPRK
jgi:hypothetical protein